MGTMLGLEQFPKGTSLFVIVTNLDLKRLKAKGQTPPSLQVPLSSESTHIPGTAH